MPASGEARSASSSVAAKKLLVATASEEINAAISPDGRWLAYQSNASGAFEVYVRPFPGVESSQWLVSPAGGTEPLWSRDGRELFYRSPKGAVMRVPIVPGATWTAGAATQLVAAQSYHIDARPGTGPLVPRSYDVSPDGRRFLMIKSSEVPAQTTTAPRIVVVLNWFEELKRLVPVQ